MSCISLCESPKAWPLIPSVDPSGRPPSSSNSKPSSAPTMAPRLFALVVEGEEIPRLGILAHEKEVQDANGLVALQPFEFVHDPALEPASGSKPIARS